MRYSESSIAISQLYNVKDWDGFVKILTILNKVRKTK